MWNVLSAKSPLLAGLFELVSTIFVQRAVPLNAILPPVVTLRVPITVFVERSPELAVPVAVTVTAVLVDPSQANAKLSVSGGH